MEHNKKKVGIIVRNLSQRGVNRFISNILYAVDSNQELHKKFSIYIIHNNDGSKLMDGTPVHKSGKNIKKKCIQGKNVLFWDYLWSTFQLCKEDFDVVIYPKNNIPFTHIFCGHKRINVIHDLLDFSPVSKNRVLNSVYNRFFFRLSCRISNKVIAISQSTKKDIIKYLKINKEKIKVIYEAVEDSFCLDKSSKTCEKLGVQKPFVLYVGSDRPRKNLKRVINSFSKIKERVTLVLVGNIKEDYKIRNVLNLRRVSDSDLIALYNEAELFVFPSLYEGFGLPILEAQACGCPVLTSNVTSCPEVAGRGAHIVNPYSEKEIAIGIKKILYDSAYKKELKRKGYKNLERFSWRKSVKEIFALV